MSPVLQPSLLMESPLSSSTSIRRPFKVQFEFVLAPDVADDDAKYLNRKLLPATNAVLRQFIQVRRPVLDGVLRISPPCESGWKICAGEACQMACKEWGEPTCDGVPIPKAHLAALQTCPVSADNCTFSEAGEGVDADLIVYVTAGSDGCAENNLATALSCAFDPMTNRPVAGVIQFCKFGRNRFQEDLVAAVHELIHVLGMSSTYWNTTTEVGELKNSTFIGADLNPIPAGDVVATFLSAKNRTRYRIITPAVREAAQRHFACPTLPGVPLEDDLGGGSAGSHWDQRILEGEIMDPVAGMDTFVGRHIVSNITLALLQDTGWYVVDYKYTGFIHWGYRAGCTFAERPSRSVRLSTDAQLQRFTCQRPMERMAQELQCTVDLTSRGICTADSTHDGLLHVQEQSSQDACLQAEMLTFTESEGNYGKYLGPGSRCIMQSPGFSRNGFASNSKRPSGGCYHTRCKGEEGSRQLYVRFEGPDLDVACPSGSYVDLSLVKGLDYLPGSQLGPCPDNSLMCGRGDLEQGWRECGESDCSANGDCLQGRCHCHIGFVGPFCDQTICRSDEDCAAGQICHWSGQCLSLQEADSIVFQGLDTSLSAHDLSTYMQTDTELSDSAKISIMVIMGCVLLVVALVCAWVLFGRKGQNVLEDTSGSAATTVQDALAMSTPPRSIPSSPQCKSGPPSVQMADVLTPSSGPSPFLNSSWGSERSCPGASSRQVPDGDVEVISLHV
eukprot:jgi/Ulvmu1/5166/UM021_0183.1